MANLDLDLELTLPAFTVAVGLTVGAETLALVGPSGAGKTTVLRAIAGLLDPERGSIRLGERTWFDSAQGVSLPPELRSVGFVFQDYALFPHLSVRGNVAFGSTGEADVDELLERLRVGHLRDVKPATLSGGERQRVALARALARRPGTLLLDEPLSALDAHTRAAIRTELQELLHELALPTILITHDFRDAAALADRAAVIVDGQLRQVGAVESLARRPADAFVAALTGNNLLRAVARPDREGARLTLEDGQELRVPEPANGPVGVAIAPWDVRVVGGATAANSLRGTVTAVSDLGGRVEARVGAVTVECPVATDLQPGEVAWLELPAAAITLVPLPAESPILGGRST
jgi:molybdate transport system ATP-binding protein